MPLKYPENGPWVDSDRPCCNSEWKFEHAKTRGTEFQCWHCKRRWVWDMWAHVWKQQ
jgi:hypothetical protein